MKRLISVTLLILALLILLNSCGNALNTENSNDISELYTVITETIETTSSGKATTSQTTTEKVNTETPLQTTFEETETKMTESEATNPPYIETEEPPEIDPYAGVPTLDDLKTSETALRFADITRGTISGDYTASILVTVVQFTDGYEVDKEYLESLFTAEYDYDNCMRSLSSYYKYNTYGNLELNFKFMYYDSGMTCEEAYNYINEKKENGLIVGNDFFFDIFDEMKVLNDGVVDYKDLDGNKDGCVDLSIFIFAEDLEKTDGCYLYGTALGMTSDSEYKPDVESPVIKTYIKTDYRHLLWAPDSSYAGNSGIRTLIQTFGHVLGLPSYYDIHKYEGNTIDTTGYFDMMSFKKGDQNSFSKFAMGYADAYVVDDIEDEITIRLRCSEEHGDLVIIPTSSGWNGTAFDEYIIIDIFAPVGANGFDWEDATDYRVCDITNTNGGVRILHVDARLMVGEYVDGSWYYEMLDDPNNAYKYVNDITKSISPAFHNSNGLEPQVEGQSRFYHLVELVPSDNSSKFREYTPVGGWSSYSWYFTTTDLFTDGDVFILNEENDAFVNAPYMNNGSTLDYSVTVNRYYEDTHEAVITIKNISNND